MVEISEELRKVTGLPINACPNVLRFVSDHRYGHYRRPYQFACCANH